MQLQWVGTGAQLLAQSNTREPGKSRREDAGVGVGLEDRAVHKVVRTSAWLAAGRGRGWYGVSGHRPQSVSLGRGLIPLVSGGDGHRKCSNEPGTELR